MPSMQVKGVGTTSFQLESRDSLHMRDVLFVPGLKKNLLSISALEDRGYKVAFVDGQVLVWPKGSSIDSTGVIGVREGGLYRLLGCPTQALVHDSISTKIIERYFGVRLASLIPFHHYDPFRIGWLWFRCILTISMILSIFSNKLIKFIEEVILGTILGGTSQCNSSLESGGTRLQDRMMRSDFQWLGKPLGEIRRFSEVKRLIN
jgi:hypothetical protein